MTLTAKLFWRQYTNSWHNDRYVSSLCRPSSKNARHQSLGNQKNCMKPVQSLFSLMLALTPLVSLAVSWLSFLFMHSFHRF